MRLFRIIIATTFCAAGLCFAESAYGQLTVQLPTINVFNINTVVSVPDGGTISLGGVNRYSAGRTSRGVPGLSNIPGVNRLFKNTGIGSETSSSQATASVKIISLQEMEDELMSGQSAQSYVRGNPAGASQGPSAAAKRKKAAFLSKHMGKSRGR